MSTGKSGAETALTIHWRIDQWFPDLSESLRASLKKYHEELIRYNKTVALIGVKTIPNADAIHFADCIMATRIISPHIKSDEVYDFGSGAGFPGLIMALMNPQKRFILVELDLRKSDFLKHMIKVLNLQNAQVLTRSIESIPEGTVKCAVSRGLSSLSKSILLARRPVATGGVYFHLKGEEWASEIADIPSQLCSFWQPGFLSDYKLPVGEVRFAVVKTDKIKV